MFTLQAETSLRQAGLDRRLARRALTLTRREHLAQDHLGDVGRLRPTARLSASLMTIAPRSCAGSEASEPLKEPMAVRTALAMTMSDMSSTPLGERLHRAAAARC